MTAGGFVDLECEGRIAFITLQREKKRNALNADMVAALAKVCANIERSAQTRVVILTGAGSKAFCAGGDIEEWSGYTPEAFGRFWVREGHAAFDALTRLRQPVIALLNGDAFGGGLELAACADFRIAEAHVRIGQPESGLGMIAGWSGTQRAVRRFGAQLVRRMAVLGDVLTAEQAHTLGLVDDVAATGKGIELARQWAERIAARAPLATELTKMAINAAEGEENARVFDCIAGIAVAGSSELQIGLAAYRNKEKPGF